MTPMQYATLKALPRPYPGAYAGDPGTLSLEISDPINITFDSRANRLFVFERESSELALINLRGRLRSPDTIQRFQAKEFGVAAPSGMAMDPETGTLFILDRVGPKIVQVDPGPNWKNYEGAAALREERIAEFSLHKSQPVELRGLGFNHADGGLYVFSPTRQDLYRITEDNELVHVGDFSGFDRIDPKGFVFAPSLDQTDDPRLMHLYIASSGGPSGHVSEWSLTPCVQGSAR